MSNLLRTKIKITIAAFSYQKVYLSRVHLHIRIEIIHGSHMYSLFLPRVGLYVSFLHLANPRGKSS
jgi:hypothetical protein